jgi:O-antigen/teichoic acid export membrane protein
MEKPSASEPKRLLTAAEVKRLAAASVAAVGLRQVAIRLIGLGGTIVLARLLLPRDFGVVAIGTALVMVFTFAGDAGIGAGLIRGPKAPAREDLASVLGLQLLVTVALAAITAVVALNFGLVGRVTTLMVASLPFVAFRAPGVILYERNLRYQPLVLIELLETMAYYVWAVGTVLAGWGVWGLASASLARAILGAVVFSIWSPAGFLLPRFDWNRLRPLLGFGLQYQAVNGVALVRDQGLNIGTAAIAGVAVLGLWSLAYRILQVPFMLFDSLWRVSFPAMARLLATGENPAPIMERGLAMAALVTGGVLAGLVGSTPALVPVVFGHQWAPVVAVVPWAALGLMVGGPISVATAGFLYAKGDSSSVLLSAVVYTVIWLGVSFALLRILGVEALGIGWFISSIGEALVLATRTRRHMRMNFIAPLLVPAAFAVVGSLAGWIVASSLGANIVSMFAGGITGGVIYLAAMLVLRRQLVTEAFALGRRSLGLLGN